MKACTYLVFQHPITKYFSQFQEYLGMLVMAPIPLLFPIMNIFLVPPLRQTAFQLVTCTYWRNRRKEEQSANNARNAGGDEVVMYIVFPILRLSQTDDR